MGVGDPHRRRARLYRPEIAGPDRDPLPASPFQGEEKQRHRDRGIFAGVCASAPWSALLALRGQREQVRHTRSGDRLPAVSLDRDITLLSRVPLFSELSTEQLRLLAFSAVRQELAPGQVLFREGATAESGYVVVFGGIELSVGQSGKRKVLATCEQGTLIGELALFIETRRPATATAIVSTEVLDIDRKLVTRMLNEYPHVAHRLRRILSSRLTATIGELGKIQKALEAVEARTKRA